MKMRGGFAMSKKSTQKTASSASDGAVPGLFTLMSAGARLKGADMIAFGAKKARQVLKSGFVKSCEKISNRAQSIKDMKKALFG